MSTDYQVLARKKRPQVFESIVGQEHITKTLKNAILTGRIAHAYLFTGIRGIGKTTCARVLAKALNCRQGPTPIPCNECDICGQITKGNSLDVIEIDGASNRGIDEIRELKENVKFAPPTAKYKVYIIDEVHMLTAPAFNALLKTLEEPPPHVIFILATTEAHKLPPTILSRCQRYDFRPMDREKIFEFLERVAKEEGIKVEEKALSLISDASEGSLRDSLSILESIVSVSEGEISYQNVADILGVVDSNLLLFFSEALIAKDPNRIISLVNELYSSGSDIKQFCKSFLNHLRDMIVISLSGNEKLSKTAHQSDKNQLKEQALKIPHENWIQLFSIFYEAEKEIRRADNPRLLLEVTLLKMLRIETVVPLNKILDQIAGLKGNLHNSAAGSSEVKKTPDSPVYSNPHKNTVANKNPEESESLKIEETQPPIQKTPVKENENQEFAWEEFIKKVEEESISLASFLNNGCTKEINGNKLIFGFEDSFTIQVIKKDKNLKILKLIGEKMLHKKIEVVLKKEAVKNEGNHPDTDIKDGKEVARESLFHRALKEPFIKDVLDIFSGKIVDVKVLK